MYLSITFFNLYCISFYKNVFCFIGINSYQSLFTVSLIMNQLGHRCSLLAHRLWFNMSKQPVSTSSYAMVKAIEELENNPYFEKYAAKIAQFQKWVSYYTSSASEFILFDLLYVLIFFTWRSRISSCVWFWFDYFLYSNAKKKPVVFQVPIYDVTPYYWNIKICLQKLDSLQVSNVPLLWGTTHSLQRDKIFLFRVVLTHLGAHLPHSL